MKEVNILFYMISVTKFKIYLKYNSYYLEWKAIVAYSLLLTSNLELHKSEDITLNEGEKNLAALRSFVDN